MGLPPIGILDLLAEQPSVGSFFLSLHSLGWVNFLTFPLRKYDKGFILV